MLIRDIQDIRDMIAASRARAIEASREFVKHPKLDELAKAGRLVKRTLPGGGVVVQVEKTCLVDVERKLEKDSRVVTGVTHSTAAIDRYDDSIAVDGWKLKHFRQNPVMPIDHNYDVRWLAGHWENTKAEADALTGDAHFLPPGDETADMVWGKVFGRALRAVSVGFRSIAWERRENEDGELQGFDFIEQELLETSWVVVPANPEALMYVQPPSGAASESDGDPASLDTAKLRAVRDKVAILDVLTRL